MTWWDRIRGRRTPITAFRAGLITIALTTIAVYFAFGGALPWQSSFQLRAVVTSANQLHSRTPVRIAGIDVGHVESIKRGPGRFATVTMALQDRALPIHADATLKVRPRIFLEGNFFIDLQQGTPAARTVGSGYEIPLSQTAVPVQLDQVLDVLRRGTRDNLVSLVHEVAAASTTAGATRSASHSSTGSRPSATARSRLRRFAVSTRTISRGRLPASSGSRARWHATARSWPR